MFEAITRRARRIAAVTAAGALVATGFVLPVINAVDTSADTLSADVATVTAVATTPAFTGQGTNGLVAGQSISIRADRVGTNNINSIEVRLCKSGANIAMDSDFNPSQGGKCINAPFAGSTNNDSVLADGLPGSSPTYATATFAVGTGTNTFTRQNSQTATITCDSSNPCELWVKVMTAANANQFKHFNVTYAGTPDAPTGLGVAAGAGEATLTWTAPTNTGNAPVSSYAITYTPSGGSPVTTSSTTTSKTITGLTNFVSYSFTVKANTIGSYSSVDSEAATGTPVPSAISDLVGVAEDGAISLSWSAPATPGVTDYRVTYTAAGGSPLTVFTGSTGVTYTLSSLTNDTEYTVTVAAQYGAGNFTDESNSVDVTPAVEVPSAVSDLVGVAEDGAISLSWSAPATPGVTDYRVTYTAAGGSALTVFTGSNDVAYTAAGRSALTVFAGSTGMSYTLSGLTNGTQYTVTIAAQYGSGSFTAESNPIVVTPAVVGDDDSSTGDVPVGSLTSTTVASGDVVRPAYTG